jgi:aryl-alcohol dehydrogenase-like predicted oxidoreductase
MTGAIMQATQLKTTQLEREGIGVIAYSPMASGRRPLDDGRRAPRHRSGSRGHCMDASQPPVDGAIVGFRPPEQVDPLIEAANLQLSEDDITTIEGAQ